MPQRHPHLHLALLLTALTGFSGLVYEVAWQRYLVTLLGSDSEATATILGIYLGGLALGYRLFAAATRTIAADASTDASRALLRFYGIAEAGVGVLALVFPWSFALAQRATVLLPHEPAGVGFLSDVLLTVFLVGPPTVLMGGTIPVLTQALARSLDDATRVHALIYALNTAGAFLGAAAAGFVLISWLGLVGVIRWMGVVNLVAGATFIVLGMRRRGETPHASAARTGTTTVPRFAAYVAVAVLVGFAMMALQTVLIRLAGLALGSSQFTFATVVSTWVLSLALGSLAVAAFGHVRPRSVVVVIWALALVLAALYGVLDGAPYWAYRFRILFGRTDADFHRYYLSAFAVFIGIFAVPIGLSGALLPMLFGALRQRHGELGDLAGRLYSWNTVGSMLGALLGGYALLLWLELHHIYRIAVAALLVGACVLAWMFLRRRAAVANLLAGGLALAAVCALPSWDPLRLSIGLFRQRESGAGATQGLGDLLASARRQVDVAFSTDDPIASVAVWERRDATPGLARSIRVNGKSEGEIPTDYVTMSLLALLPALLADKCEQSFVIGYGTGVTAGELAALASTRRVEVAEISRGVLAAAPLFDYGNGRVSQNPKVSVVVADAYRALLRSDARYDVITSEPSNPWVAGIETLFSRELLELARDRLAPGGIFAQWIHLDEIDTPTIAMVFHTFASVFERTSVWHMLADDVVLLGTTAAEAPDLERLERRFAERDFRAGFARAGVPDFVSVLAREVYPRGVVNAFHWDTPVHTLLRPLLNDRAGRAFFRGDHAELPMLVTPGPAAVGREQSLLRRYAARYGGRLPDDAHARVVDETSEFSLMRSTTLMAEWLAQDPKSPVLADLLERHLQIAESPHSRAIVEMLVPLFGGAGASDRVSLQTVEDVSGMFARYYHHGAPFDRAALLATWRRCFDGLAPGSACREALENVERHLGPLGP